MKRAKYAFNGSSQQAWRIKWHKLGSSLMLFAMLLGLLLTAPAAVHTNTRSAAIQPVLLQLAAQQPNESIRIIVQKNVDDLQVEQLVQSLGGEILTDLSIIHAFAAKLPASAIHDLAASPAVRWVSLDAPVVSTAAKAGKRTETNYYADTLRYNALLKQNRSLTGAGIGVAVVDSGISQVNDLDNLVKVASFNPNAKSPNDTYGHGTHVAGIIAGSGSSGGGAFKGLAPAVNLIGLKISDDTGMAYESDTVKALQWILDNRDLYNIRVANLSINSTAESSYHQSALNAAVEILWFNGIVVVASSGNKGTGISNTANSAPANDPFIITVGATDEKKSTSRSDDTIANFTAFGTTIDGYRKPEMVAPGSDIFSLLSNQSEWGRLYPDRTLLGGNQYFRLSGTSMAAPMVTGAVALLLQDEPHLTPDQVKYRLMNTGTSMPISNGNSFAVSYLDIYAAVNGTTTQSANTGVVASQLLWSGDNPVAWNSVNWNSVNWNSVNWNSVNWNSVNWNSVNWNSAVLEGATGKAAGIDGENADENPWVVPAWTSPEEREEATETPDEPWQPQHRIFVPMVTR